MNYLYPFLLILSFSTLGVYAQSKEELMDESDATKVGVRDLSQTIIGIADILNDSIIHETSFEAPQRNLCNALKVSTNETMLQMTLDTFYTNLQEASSYNSQLGALVNTLKTHSSKGSMGIDDKYFFDGLIYELKCPNNGNPIYIYHFLLLDNPILIDGLIDRSDNQIQKEQFSKKKFYNDKYENLLSLGMSYLPEMKKSVMKRFYIGAVRSIKRQIERD